MTPGRRSNGQKIVVALPPPYQPISLLHLPCQPISLLYFLCSGKAPYHNYPPMKILMMTLGRDPPTLDDCLEDGDNAKYSKPFKKIIEKYVQVCLISYVVY